MLANKTLCLIVACLISGISFGAVCEESKPQDLACKPLGEYQEKLLVIPESKLQKSRLVLIHNISNNPLWLTHPVKRHTASAGWTTLLSVNHWSAIAIDEKAFTLACVESLPGAEQYIPCTRSIKVFELENVGFCDGSNGTYWVAEDQSLTALLREIQTRGIQLKPSGKTRDQKT